MAAAQAAENSGDESGLIYEGYIHQFQPEPTHKAAEAPSLKISSHRTSLE